MRSIDRVRDAYGAVVARLVHLSVIGLVMVGVAAAGIFGLSRTTPTGFLPEDDQGALFVIVQLPGGASIARTSEVVRQAEAVVRDDPAVADFTSVIGLNFIDNYSQANSAFMDARTTARTDRLLRPRAIAIVGVSPEPGHPGSTVLANLERCAFEGAIHLVSRSRTEFAGRACVPSIDDLPFGVDVAVLVVPQAVVIDAIGALGRRGVGAAIVFASGYAEMGEAGRAEQEKLTAAARAANVAVLGPNCIGMAPPIVFPSGVPPVSSRSAISSTE